MRGSLPVVKGTVLVVDDHADIRDTLRELLQDEGYEVRTACDGAEALAAMPALPRPGLVLMDLIMPVMDGLEAINRMRADPALASLPVVIMSASASVRVPDGVRLVRKPIALQPFLDLVADLCR